MKRYEGKSCGHHRRHERQGARYGADAAGRRLARFGEGPLEGEAWNPAQNEIGKRDAVVAFERRAGR